MSQTQSFQLAQKSTLRRSGEVWSPRHYICRKHQMESLQSWPQQRSQVLRWGGHASFPPQTLSGWGTREGGNARTKSGVETRVMPETQRRRFSGYKNHPGQIVPAPRQSVTVLPGSWVGRNAPEGPLLPSWKKGQGPEARWPVGLFPSSKVLGLMLESESPGLQPGQN